MARQSRTHWDEARTHLREWLAERATTPSELARLAGLNRSVLSRFLEKEQPLSPASAAKLYGVVKQNLDIAGREHWVQWLNLEGVRTSLDESLVGEATDAMIGSYPNIEQGFYWFREAWKTASLRVVEAIPLFERAERAFGPHSSMAALSACEIVQHCINLTDMPRAELEIFRVEQAYRDVMDVQTRSRFLGLRAMVAYDSHDFERALRLGNEWLAFGERYHYDTQAEHLLALVQLGLAERLREDDPSRKRLLEQAEHNMRLMCRYYEREGHPLKIGFQYIRLGQILREQGRADEARAARARARRLCRHDGGSYSHIVREEANLALLDGETGGARAMADAALEGWVSHNYAGGMARAAGVVALSMYMEGRPQEALEPAVVAASLAPQESSYKGGRFTHLVQEISHDVRHDAGTQRYQVLLHQLQERVRERRGYIVYLACAVPDRSGEALRLLATPA